MAEMKPFTFCPKGVRWPWYPRFVGQVRMTRSASSEPGMASFDLETVGPMERKRVGFRLWIKHLTRHPESYGRAAPVSKESTE